MVTTFTSDMSFSSLYSPQQYSAKVEYPIFFAISCKVENFRLTSELAQAPYFVLVIKTLDKT